MVFIANLGGKANSIKLLLAGMALSAVCSAFSSFIVYFANNKEGMQSIAFWLMGSLSGAKWDSIFIIAPIVMISILFLLDNYFHYMIYLTETFFVPTTV